MLKRSTGRDIVIAAVFIFLLQILSQEFKFRSTFPEINLPEPHRASNEEITLVLNHLHGLLFNLPKELPMGSKYEVFKSLSLDANHQEIMKALVFPVRSDHVVDP